MAYLAPIDGDGSGTWLAANELAVTLCLLNLYNGHEQRRRQFVSRGCLVTELAGCSGAIEIAERLERADLESYRPFTLLVLELQPTAGGGLAHTTFCWDGQALARLASDLPLLTSSSYDAAGVEAARRRLWIAETTTCPPSSESMLAFHGSHLPRRGAYSPCMHRPDASTVSFSRVVVDSAIVSMSYADGPPCRSSIRPARTLARRVPTFA